MKSIKFLAALAVPAMFAACSNEELASVQQDAAQQGQEFVGAELVSKGMSFSVVTGADSRLDNGGNFTSTDKLGLGWVVAGTYNVAQSEESAPDQSELYGNHLFYTEDGKNFETKANIYKGWHFAYCPFDYMESLGTVKTFDVNPTQTSDWTTDRFNTMFYVSAREFLSKEKNLDENTYQLQNVKYELFPALNTITVNVQPNETFTKSFLSELNINSIKLAVGAGVFAGKLELDPTALAEVQYDENGSYSTDLTRQEVFKSLSNALKMTTNNNGVQASKRTSITTEVENDAIDLTGEQKLRIHTLPATATIEPENVVFTIEVDGGTFTVEYISEDSEEYNEVAKYNNATIEKLVTAYAKGGAMTTFGGVLYKDMNLQLTEDMFEPNFEAISTEAEWNAAVKIADALGMDEVTFNIVNTKGLVFTNIDKEDGDADLINLPEGNLTVTGDKMVLGAEGAWPAEGLTVETAVEVNADLTVADKVEMTADGGIVNNAAITAGYLSHINGVDNQGEIEVVYGSYVTITTGKNGGVISYEVPAVSSELTAAKIQEQIAYLIATTGNTQEMPYANVNKLVINENVELNLTVGATSTGGSDAVEDPYRPSGSVKPSTSPATLIPELNAVSLEINGGKVTSTNAATMKNAVIDGGSLDNVTLTDGLTVADGTATNCGNIIGAVTAKNAAVTATSITGDVTAEDAEITANTITGTVKAKGETTINNAAISSDLTVANGTTTLNNVNVAGDLIANGNVNATNVNVSGTLTVKAGSYTNTSDEDTRFGHIVVSAGEFTTNSEAYVETIKVYGKVTVATGKTIWYTVPETEGGYIQEGTTTGKVLFKGTELASSDTELRAALTEGKNVILLENVTTTDAESNGYGTTGVNVNGGVFDGNGHTIKVEGADETWDSAIAIKGGTIKNLTVAQGFRGIFIKNGTEKVVLENVVVDGPTYTISCDQAGNQGLEAYNSTFKGWTSYAETLGEAYFENCAFGAGAGYNFSRPYAPTTYVNCAFEAGHKMDLRANVTFENCTIDGVALTNENLATLVTGNITYATVK